MKIPLSAVLVSWGGFLWATATSVVVALTIQAVPALVIPIVASALLPVAAPSPVTVRIRLGVIASLVLLAFMGLAILSVGWFYLPSFVCAIAVATGAEREARAC